MGPMCTPGGAKRWACAWVRPAVYRSSSGPLWPSARKLEHWKTLVSPLCHSVTVESGYTSPNSHTNSIAPRVTAVPVRICLSLLFSQRFQKAIRPLNSWRVNNLNSAGRTEEHVEPERVEAPFTVTLTDMDFTAMTWEAWSQPSQRGERWWAHSDEQTMLLREGGIYHYVICPSLDLVAEQTVSPAGQCGLFVLFILLCMIE